VIAECDAAIRALDELDAVDAHVCGEQLCEVLDAVQARVENLMAHRPVTITMHSNSLLTRRWS